MQTTQVRLTRLARRRVAARLGWYTHATTYACVITGLALLGWWQGRLWPLAPALGWGLGLVMHGLAVFVWGSGSQLKGAMIQREHERLQLREQARL
jgi:hypothetical protein